MHAEAAIALSQQHGFNQLSAMATVLCGWAWMDQGQVQAAIPQIEAGLANWRAIGLEKATKELADKGYSVVQTLNLPPARVAYFDTYTEIGVMTEIIGLTEAGYQLIEQVKSGNF